MQATERLTETVLALAETLVGGQDTVSPIDPQKATESASKNVVLLGKTLEDIKTRGVLLPTLPTDLNFGQLEVLKFTINPEETDLVPDPMLLLMKAAINWSWRCDQKLLPACGSVYSEEEEPRFAPSTIIPFVIEFAPMPETPDDDDLSFSG